MDFFLFLLVNATLFIRPAEIVPALLGLPIYNVLILVSLLTSLGPVIAQLDPAALRDRPITVCALGVLAMIVLSHLARFDFWSARVKGVDFVKVVLYYLLLLATVNTPARLRTFLTWLAIFAVILTGLSLLHYHGFVRIPALEALERKEIDERTGEATIVLQLVSTGIYNDPNDFCLILVVGVMISLYRLSDRQAGPMRALWLAPCGLFLYAVILTRSRGGFLGLLAALMVLFVGRFGWRKAIPIGMLVLPAMILLSGGRQTELSTGADTAQERIGLWREALSMLRGSPLTGIGAGTFVDEAGLVAHNSFVHAYAELGLVGGTFFLGTFYVALRSLHGLRSPRAEILDPGLRGLRPYLLAMIAGYVTGLMSISRCYIVPTYMATGLVAAYLRMVPAVPDEAIPRFDGRLIRQLAGAAISFIILIYVFVRIN